MNNNLNPVFSGILNNFANPVKKQKLSFDAQWAIDIIVENGDDKIELQDDLTALIEAIKDNPEELVGYIKNTIDIVREELVEDGKCPDCGTDLEFVRDKSMDTYVPYRDTSVIFKEGGIMKCPDCGFNEN
jgi:transcription initiation factor IIE alpha subunit